MTQEEAEAKLKKLLGPECRTEYDPKMTGLRCWLYDVSERGYVRGCFGGRDWEGAFDDLKVHRGVF